ncbi:ATP-dependent DNA helicase RecG, partial [Patescibacteria group bacterium]
IKSNSDQPLHTGRLVPIYPETYGVSSKWIRSRINPLLSQVDTFINDWLPQNIIDQEKLISLKKALKQIHLPEDQKQLDEARKRLAFDELFLLQLASQKRKYLWQHKKLSHPLQVNQEKVLDFISNLPFTLTKAQNQSIKEILKDLGEEQPMNRLLQGDVGSGKTVVAAAAAYVTYLNNLKSIVLAPTEILAQQHFKTLSSTLEPLGLSVELITSSTSKKIKESISKTKADIVVGTHALLYRDIPENLGLLVVDEQHRFGVEQRAKLLKAKKTPHLLAMTATPIPRTVALSVYGELDLSIIDEMPKGRKSVKTWVVSEDKRQNAYQWIEEQISQDDTQAFIVCPLIEESESDLLSNVRSVETEYEYLTKKIYKNLSLGLLHGRMKSKEKQKAVEEFKKKTHQILVSTPVIEVGIDIPNASIILIESSERFGLAQLHQLRGRVGRGDKQSYCLLFTSTKQAQDIKRLKAMETNNSGFKLAELDLKLRGPGEMYGVKQHGFTRLKIANFSDQILIKTTHNHAKELITKNPTLSNYSPLALKLDNLLEKEIEPN